MASRKYDIRLCTRDSRQSLLPAKLHANVFWSQLGSSKRQSVPVHSFRHSTDENKDYLKFKDEELQAITNIFSLHNCPEVDDDTDYLQAVYDDECEILSAVSAQADVVSKHLGSRAKDDMLASMGSIKPNFIVGSGSTQRKRTRAPFDLDDSTDGCVKFLLHERIEVLAFVVDQLALPRGRGRSQRKSKAAVPKPPRGSGLNPSGLATDNQINIPAEQPRMMQSYFDPYGESGEWQAINQGSQSSGPYPQAAPPQAAPQQDQVQWPYGAAAGRSDQYMPYSQEAPPQDYAARMHATTPIPRWADEAPDGGAMMRMGEIPSSNVMHTAGPARSTQRRPRVASSSRLGVMDSDAYDPRAEASRTPSPELVQFLKDLCLKIIELSKDFMLADRVDRKDIVTSVITKAIVFYVGENDATDYRIARVNMLVSGPDPLLFMHEFILDEEGNPVVLGKFQNSFIMANIIQYVWSSELAHCLAESPLQKMKFVFGTIGAATNCALLEQVHPQVTVDPFTGHMHWQKFKDIVNALDALDEGDRLEFERYVGYVMLIGPSQTRRENDGQAPFDLL
ncbi:hypothetical protein DFH29DRAFT_875215 [Suillus ampliporus]|nr:hypothetical protein DFH29DRAFT_875215 [Suillus ampliporus]